MAIGGAPPGEEGRNDAREQPRPAGELQRAAPAWSLAREQPHGGELCPTTLASGRWRPSAGGAAGAPPPLCGGGARS